MAVQISTSLNTLYSAARKFDVHSSDNKRELLNKLANSSLRNAKEIISYHDCLLFLIAYPENEELLKLAKRELARLTGVVKTIMEGIDERKKQQLFGSGIAYSEFVAQFSLPLTLWIFETYANNIEIDSCDGERDFLLDLLEDHLLPGEANDSVNRRLSFSQNLKKIKGNSDKSDLEFVLDCFDNYLLDSSQLDKLWYRLGIFTLVRMNNRFLSRTTSRSFKRDSYYHNELIRHVNLSETISQPLSKKRKLSPQNKLQLQFAAKGVLCALERENDPITMSDEEYIECHDMGRGYDLALFEMEVWSRLPLETSVGFMFFQNSVPVAYGDVLLFFSRCKISFNVFEPFRRGEGANIFAQLLRLLHQRFGTDHFVIEPFQFGKDNEEGIKSGAFWFYYRFGFRPVDAFVDLLAEEESKRMERDMNYRSPLSVMRKLATCNLEFLLNEDAIKHPSPDPDQLSKIITQTIEQKYAGDRDHAVGVCIKNLESQLGYKTQQLISWDNYSLGTWSILLGLINGLADWDVIDKKRIRRIIITKSRGGFREMNHAVLLQNFQKLRRALVRVERKYRLG